LQLLIKNGTLIDPSTNRKGRGSILIEDGIIKRICENIPDIDGKIIDAQGMIVAPGFIDIHVHFRDPGYEHKEDIVSGIRSAEAGGYTAVCTMPNTSPVPDNTDTLIYMKEKASSLKSVKLYPVCAATVGLNGEGTVNFEELRASGAVAFSDDGKPVENTTVLKKAMESGYASGMKYVSHSEDIHLAKGGHMNEGSVSAALGLPGIPVVAESSEIARDCMLAEYLDVPVHIAHVSAEMSVDIIRHFKEKGVKVTAETAPHYLVLTDEAVRIFGTNAKMNPPLRGEKDRLALIKGINAGIIDCIATDHAPHHKDEKNVDFCKAPFGIIGLETALPVVLSLYHKGFFTIEKVVGLFTEGYRIMGIEGGTLKEGVAADITIFDPEIAWKIDREKFLSKSENTPFHDMEVKGAVTYTIVDGNIVFSRCLKCLP
jgi:dihydroorotase